MKRVVFLVSSEMIKIAEMAMLKLGFATRAEFFKHTAFLFLHQAGFINAKTLGLHEIAQTSATTSALGTGEALDLEGLSNFEAHQKELADFLIRYNRENGTDFPLPPPYDRL